MGKKKYKPMRSSYHIRAKRRANRRYHKSEIRRVLNISKILWIWKIKQIIKMKWQEKIGIYDTINSINDPARKKYTAKLITRTR